MIDEEKDYKWGNTAGGFSDPQIYMWLNNKRIANRIVASLNRTLFSNDINLYVEKSSNPNKGQYEIRSKRWLNPLWFDKVKDCARVCRDMLIEDRKIK